MKRFKVVVIIDTGENLVDQIGPLKEAFQETIDDPLEKIVGFSVMEIPGSKKED